MDEDAVAFRIGESGGYGGNSSEFEERELFGAVSDDLVFDLAEGLELDFRVRGSETGEDVGLTIAGGRGGGREGGGGGGGGRHGEI